MNEFSKSFKENLFANIALIVALCFTIIHLFIITFNVFGITAIKFYNEFNYLIAYIFVIVSLCIFLLGFFITKITKLNIPQWFQIVFYAAFFIFTNTYYAINAYNNFIGLLFFYSYLAFISVICNLSVFFNIQKDENNKLRASKIYILTSVFFYSMGTNALILFIVSIVKTIFFPFGDFTKLSFFVFDFTAMLAITTIMIIIFALSLSHSKRFINSCLIKTKSE
ncbi:MAG: hypothetical protein IJX17_06230 [Clostridia bacterium]|nr:hypothetical protein [Clostridia bacterium]